MELDEQSLLEELFALKREIWDNYPTGTSELLFTEGGVDCFHETPIPVSLNYAPFQGLAFQAEPNFDCLSEVYCPFGSGLFSAAPELQPSCTMITPSTVSLSAQDNEEIGVIYEENHSTLHEEQSICKIEPGPTAHTPSVFGGTGPPLERRNGRLKKVEGLPSKNLMAERRRRKRLNDRLSLLRSIVPKISRMDRTSILGDTIDYMKELLEKIKSLQEEIKEGQDHPNLPDTHNEVNPPNEIFPRNSPKFNVERSEGDTRIEVFCAAKPGLLMSTVNTLETLGLEIQQCVVSCFNDFGMQASCSEDKEKREAINSEEIKQALLRTTGYGGKCV